MKSGVVSWDVGWKSIYKSHAIFWNQTIFLLGMYSHKRRCNNKDASDASIIPQRTYCQLNLLEYYVPLMSLYEHYLTCSGLSEIDNGYFIR